MKEKKDLYICVYIKNVKRQYELTFQRILWMHVALMSTSIKFALRGPWKLEGKLCEYVHGEADSN